MNKAQYERRAALKQLRKAISFYLLGSSLTVVQFSMTGRKYSTWKFYPWKEREKCNMHQHSTFSGGGVVVQGTVLSRLTRRTQIEQEYLDTWALSTKYSQLSYAGPREPEGKLLSSPKRNWQNLFNWETMPTSTEDISPEKCERLWESLSKGLNWWRSCPV